jgi:hypothetical protein
MVRIAPLSCVRRSVDTLPCPRLGTTGSESGHPLFTKQYQELWLRASR